MFCQLKNSLYGHRASPTWPFSGLKMAKEGTKGDSFLGYWVLQTSFAKDSYWYK